ncbi:MAG TPA: hypothetical protein VLU92_04225 [Candidatus Dormibacteraeota bacterium]|nr:hypothetical protein [Candidatus Dormibacteraeota bacterium]
MNYGHLIKRPFEIVARRPYLWLLGFLAGGATVNNFSSSGTGYTQSSTYSGPSWAAVQNTWNGNWEWIVGILAFLLVVCIAMFILGCIATGGIIHAAVEHDAGRDCRLGTAWRLGYASGWRIAGLRLLTFLLALVPGMLVGTLVVAAVVAAINSSVAALGFGLFAVVALLISVAFWLVLGIAFELAQRIVVLEGGDVAASLSAGFRMVRSHLKEVGLGWLLLMVLCIVIGIAVAVIAVAGAIPAVAIGLGGWAIGGTTGAVVAGSVGAVFFFGVLGAAAGAYSAYSSVYWTLLFTSVRALPAPAAHGAVVRAA